MHIPKNILVALLLLCCSWLGCKEKEEDEGLPDLSRGGYFYTYHWVFSYQVVDSIDASSKGYLSKWPGKALGYEIKLRSLNESHTLYEKTTDWEDIRPGGTTHVFRDTVVMDANGYMYMKMYKTSGWGTEQPDSLGTFIGHYEKATHTVQGYLRYQAYWYCPYCPMGSYRQRYALVNARAVLE